MKKTFERVFQFWKVRLLGIILLLAVLGVAVWFLGVRGVLPVERDESANASRKGSPKEEDPQGLEDDIRSKYSNLSYLNSLTSEELKALGAEIARLDLKLGIEILGLLEGNYEGLFLFAEGFFESWATIDPQSCTHYITSQWGESGLKFRSQTHSVVEIWTKADPVAASEFLKKLALQTEDRSGDASEILITALDVWSQDTPSDAYQFLRTMPKDYREGPAISFVIRNWAKIDPHAALANADGLDKDGIEINLLYGAALSSWSESNSQESAEWFVENVPVEEQQYLEDAVGEISQNLFLQTDASTVVEWADRLSFPELKGEALVDLATSWGASDRTDEDLLSAFAEGFRAGDSSYDAALYKAASSAATSRPELVSEWLNAQEALSEHTDPVINGLIDAISGTQPFETVLAWAEEIVDPKLRARQQHSILVDWSLENGGAHIEWLANNQNSLSLETIERLVADGVISL